MARLLHLSDLHLGKPEAHQWLDQHKGTLAGTDRRAEKDILRETIGALAETGELAATDAVVISGDLTNRGHGDGFEEFSELVEMITPFVPARRILVVPGNHDVPQEHGPGDPARYTGFLRVTRELGMATPLLDGIDFDTDGHLLASADQRPPHLVIADRFAILPINSSHFCWGVEPLPDGVAEQLLTVPPDQLAAATEEIRRYDIPRVSNAQMTAVAELLADLDDSAKLGASNRVVIAVLHHQLLPVSAREEFKSFESLTNLGAVREFLASVGVEVVLHGHKHESGLYWDYVADQRRFSAAPARILVEAAPANFRPGSPIARTITIGSRIDAPDVEVGDVHAPERRPGPISHAPVGRARLWDPIVTDRGQDARVVRGSTASAVYARVQSLFDSTTADTASHYLVCEIEDPRDAAQLPADYPLADDRANRQAWMSDLVEWWQLPEPLLGHGVDFNHGERIYHRWGNQVQRAAALLSSAARGDPTTTRASILLLDPQRESSPQTPVQFPSFVAIQLQLVRKSGAWHLECTGSFRKQEMRYWWPINVAELAQVQTAVAAGVTINGSHPTAGLLRTVTAQAIAEDRIPVVALPAVDRAVDQNHADLWRMAFSLIDPVGTAGNDIRPVWRHYLDDLRPTGSDDQVPAMSRRGLRRVLDCVDAILTGPDTTAVEALRKLVDIYELFDDPSAADAQSARSQIRDRLGALDAALDALFSAAPTGLPAPAGSVHPRWHPSRWFER